MINATSQFSEAIRAAGLTPPETIEADGKLRRFASNGKRGDDAGWYLLHGDGIPAGSFGDWRSGLAENWRADIGRTLTPAEEAAHRARVDTMRREREAEQAKRKVEAQARAEAIWQAASLDPDDHAYLSRKGIKAHGAKLHDGALVIPLRADGVLHSLQFIGADGGKRFLSGGRVAGCYFSIGTTQGAAKLCIAEGFATGATIHEAMGYPVVVAFNAGNLLLVAKAMRAKFPHLSMIVCADDDSATPGNPGLSKATEAAQSIDGKLAIPNFGNNRPGGATDFNDMAALCGAEAVVRAIATASAPAKDGQQTDGISSTSSSNSSSNGWPEPQPLTVKLAPEPYPLDALPETIRAAVEEVAGFVKAPLPLVASSALAALSLAAQAHVDVKRAERLQGPVGLFLLTIADSGERKSTCDGFFSTAIREYQVEQAEAAKPILKNYKAALDAWEAKHGGIKEQIRQLAKTGKSTLGAETELSDLMHTKPEPPRVPRLLYADATPEALAFGLAKHWPSGGVVSAEAGIVFGSHGMGKDSAMRNLALLNQLWDGTSLTIDRRSTESFTVRGARLTVALQVQEPTLRDFFARSGALARGTGFLARFLVAWPESTQGSRNFTEAPATWTHLAEFNRRITAILANPVPIDDDGALSPALLSLAPEAKAAWIEYHNAVEGELGSGGELFDVRDVASKSADNAVRLAALFQIFEHGMSGAVGLDCFESASLITAWHLGEARRFFGELALPADLADAARLDTWLIEHCRRERALCVGKNHTRQHGPLRDGARLDVAIRELADLDRLRLLKEGKRLTIQLNPVLVEVTP